MLSGPNASTGSGAHGERTIDVAELLLRQGEQHRERLQLRDDDDAVRVRGMHDVALVDLADAGAAGDRRNDLGVVEDRLGVVDLRLIELHLGFLLRHRHFLGVELLARDRVAGHELRVAFEIEPRVGERRFVQRLLRHRLIVGGLIGGGVDLRQHIAALDLLAFGVVDAEQLAVDLRPHRHRVQGSDGADAVEIDRHVGPLGQSCNDRDRPVVATPAAAKARLLLLLRRLPPDGTGDPDENEGNDCSRDRSSSNRHLQPA